MIKEFNNEAWQSSDWKESYIITLKSIRYHKAVDRLDSPTTSLLFVSKINDASIRQHFEDSSKHFKTYNTFNFTNSLLDAPSEAENGTLRKLPFWPLNILDVLLNTSGISFLVRLFLRGELRDHFSYRSRLKSMPKEQLAQELSALFHLVGLTSLSQLNVFIGSNNSRNSLFAVKFMAENLNHPTVKNLLGSSGVSIPEGCQTLYGFFDKKKNRIDYQFTDITLDINKSPINYLQRKTNWVLDRKRVKDLTHDSKINRNKTFIIGRRLLTRGHDPLNETALIQSYDYKKDPNLTLLSQLLKNLLRELSTSHPEALVVVENYPNQISYLISKDEDLKSYLNGNNIALASIEPESKDVYVFEGDQFVQRSLKHIY